MGYSIGVWKGFPKGGGEGIPGIFSVMISKSIMALICPENHSFALKSILSCLKGLRRPLDCLTNMGRRERAYSLLNMSLELCTVSLQIQRSSW